MSDFETVLDPLLQITRRFKDIEAYVLWHKDGAWSDAGGEFLETDEIVFYAEGLLMEGFGMAWDHLTDPGFGDQIRLCFWQAGRPDLPPMEPGAHRVTGGRVDI